MGKNNDFDLTISESALAALAPELLEALRDFVGYGLCRMNNRFERDASAKHFAQMAREALRKFPSLKLQHASAKTIVTE